MSHWYEQLTQEQLYKLLTICISREDNETNRLVRLLVHILDMQDSRLHTPVVAANSDVLHEEMLEKFRRTLEEGTVVNTTLSKSPLRRLVRP